jgi:hypothetical protein
MGCILWTRLNKKILYIVNIPAQRCNIKPREDSQIVRRTTMLRVEAALGDGRAFQRRLCLQKNITKGSHTLLACT